MTVASILATKRRRSRRQLTPRTMPMKSQVCRISSPRVQMKRPPRPSMPLRWRHWHLSLRLLRRLNRLSCLNRLSSAAQPWPNSMPSTGSSLKSTLMPGQPSKLPLAPCRTNRHRFHCHQTSPLPHRSSRQRQHPRCHRCLISQRCHHCRQAHRSHPSSGLARPLSRRSQRCHRNPRLTLVSSGFPANKKSPRLGRFC